MLFFVNFWWVNLVSFIVNNLVFDFFNWFLFFIVVLVNFLKLICILLFLMCVGSFVIKFCIILFKLWRGLYGGILYLDNDKEWMLLFKSVGGFWMLWRILISFFFIFVVDFL